jgi:hypothetical protein
MSLPRHATVGGNAGPVGPLGLAALCIVVTLVASDAWWVLAIAAVGGLALGALLVSDSRRRGLESYSRPPTLRH